MKTPPTRQLPGLPIASCAKTASPASLRAYFEELLQRDWELAQRDSHDIGLVLFDIDDLGLYNDKFERTGGDAVHPARRPRVDRRALPPRRATWWELGRRHVSPRASAWAELAAQHARRSSRQRCAICSSTIRARTGSNM